MLSTFSLKPLFLKFLALLLVCFGTAFSSPLVLKAEDDTAPWSQKDGIGYAIDIVRAAIEAVGMQVEMRVVPYNRCKYMVMRGSVAGCFSMSWNSELEGVVAGYEYPASVYDLQKKGVLVFEESDSEILNLKNL